MLPVKVWAIVALIEADGWRLVTTKGSQRQFKHHEKAGRITIPGRLRDDAHPKTLKSILRQAGLDQ